MAYDRFRRYDWDRRLRQATDGARGFPWVVFLVGVIVGGVIF